MTDPVPNPATSPENSSVDKYTPAAGSITMFSTTWCGYCHRLKTQLKSAGIGWTEIDIEQQPDAAALVAAINGGDQIVPTVVYPNGTTATNPSLRDVQAALQ